MFGPVSMEVLQYLGKGRRGQKPWIKGVQLLKRERCPQRNAHLRRVPV